MLQSLYNLYQAGREIRLGCQQAASGMSNTCLSRIQRSREMPRSCGNPKAHISQVTQLVLPSVTDHPQTYLHGCQELDLSYHHKSMET